MTTTDSSRPCKTLRLVLGDQLNLQHSWFEHCDPETLYVIAELHQEASYTRHHVQKLCAFFAAMKCFAQALEAMGHKVLHLTLQDTAAYSDLPDLIQKLCQRHRIERFDFQLADEYRLRQQLLTMTLDQGITVTACASEHFLLPESDFSSMVTAGKHNRMESFYRKMRKRLNLLMDGDQPLGGQWNYDADNRQRLRAADMATIPEPLRMDNDVTQILQRLDDNRIDYFGEATASLLWPVDRTQSLQLLEHFCTQCLHAFGRFQDAMTSEHEHRWSLFHSRLSFALNSKMLHPMEVVDAAIQRFEQADGGVSIAQIEGFVRQIVGWREYVRAVYWVNMPGYASLNELKANRDLPAYFWDGDTRMQCMKQAIGQSLEFAYAHHIQRLMITGNFCMLAGIEPDQVDAWYLGVYIDAIEWVEMPNTRGMSQFADNGLIATKPYSAGGNYINKMSDHCKHCHYKIKQKTERTACPFNSLYWDFMIRHRDRLERNPRIGMVYRSWDRQDAKTRAETLTRASWCLENLDSL